MKIYHLPYDQGSFASHCARQEARSGFLAYTMARQNPFSVPPDIEIRAGIHPAEWLTRICLINTSADIIHFNYGSSLFDPPWRQHFLLDLPFYKRSIKKVMTYQGSDIRMSYDDAVCVSRNYEMELGYKAQISTADGIIPEAEIMRKQKRYAKASKYIDRFFALNPDLLTHLPGTEFLPYPAPPKPGATPPVQFDTSRPLRVVHMATNRILKGTGLIERALKSLSQHYNIEYKILVRQPHRAAMAALDWADVLIDQVCLGWYGGQAVEALQRGKPVLCYLRKEYQDCYLPALETGLISVTHETIGNSLAALIDNPSRLDELSAAGIGFADTFHNPATIVQKIYRGWI